ncbi:UNKNOWN [Stylonychia lemnae]|uniref:Transmembrane protein n=1 Tax=Stylonychia lemnae TaxID=5949 RepID=A0A078BER0_STYLE|nr:UNKNOWN [Stylonychia lemnae]|eukprot:CDW91647.1 UNKNOWN [Stylonychia lemnae]
MFKSRVYQQRRSKLVADNLEFESDSIASQRQMPQDGKRAYNGYQKINNSQQQLNQDQQVQNPESLSRLVNESKYMSNQTDGILGVIFIVAAGIIFSLSLYSFWISKFFMPYTGNKVLDWIKDDEYYCFLIPATLVNALIMTYFNWLAMKYFRQG